MLRKYWFLWIFWFLLLMSCLNRYEKKLIGEYGVESYEKVDSSNRTELDLPVLRLNANKTFVLAFKSRNITGKWQANDYGDFTIIEFSGDNMQVQGKMIGTETQPEIVISIPEIFCCPFLKSLVFKQKR